jgi:hypothetical protein
LLMYLQFNLNEHKYKYHVRVLFGECPFQKIS